MSPKRLARKKIYQSPWVNLYVDKVKLKGGRIIQKYHYLDIPKDAVGVVIENDQNEILLVKVDRYVTNKVGWETPGGAVDAGESILEAAKREVEEETGYETANNRHIHSYHPNNGISNATFHVVFGKSTSRISEFDTNEIDKVKFFSKERVEDMIDSGEITCGLSLTALLLYFRKQGQQKTKHQT